MFAKLLFLLFTISLSSIRYQVRVGLDLILIKLDNAAAFGIGQLAVLDAFKHRLSKRVVELRRLESHRRDRVAARCSVDHLINDVTILADEDMGFVGHAEEVM